MRLGAPFILTAILLATSGCQTPCDNDLSCPGADEVCNPTSRSCEKRAASTAPTCSSDGECTGGRACVDTQCRFAPVCLQLSGAWDAYTVPVDSGPAQRVVLGQEDCTLVTQQAALPSIADVRVDRLGNLTGGTITTDLGTRSNCSGMFHGDDTIAIACDGITLLHLYARPSTSGRLEPQRCNSNCTCETNAAGVPVCAP